MKKAEEYETKDSGKRMEYNSGMRRDLSEGKPRPDLVIDEFMDALFIGETTKQQVMQVFRGWRKDSMHFYVLLKDILDYSKLSASDLALHAGGVLARGGIKYGFYNWQKANSQEELDRFYESAERHLVQWLGGIDDEDHLAGALFNIMCAEWLRNKLKGKK